MQHLTNLSTLYLHNNLLTSINGLEHLTKLISLDLAFNQLTEIKRLETLTNLKRLDLRKNQLSELPEFLLRLELPICSYNHRFENYIDVWHNPFTNPHFEIVKEGNKAIKDYFERRKKNNIPLLNETRLVSQNVNQVPNTKPIPFTLKAFVSYSKFDGESATDGINYLEEFKQTLAPLSGRFNNLIETWDDTFLIAGEEWGNTIKSQLNSCDIIFLLISRHFLNTRYIIDVELANAVLRHKKKECIIVPIILKACGWTDIPILKDFNGIPRKGNNISAWKKNVDWTSRDDAWHHVYGEVKKLLEDFKSKK